MPALLPGGVCLGPDDERAPDRHRLCDSAAVALLGMGKMRPRLPAAVTWGWLNSLRLARLI